MLSFVGRHSRDKKAPRALPKAERRCFGINVDQRPPCFLVHLAIELAMMDAAKRDSELVADLAAKGARLHEPEMVGIAGLPTTHEARQRGDEIEVFFVANPPHPLGHRASATNNCVRMLCGACAIYGAVRSRDGRRSEIRFMLLLGR